MSQNKIKITDEIRCPVNYRKRQLNLEGELVRSGIIRKEVQLMNGEKAFMRIHVGVNKKYWNISGDPGGRDSDDWWHFK